MQPLFTKKLGSARSQLGGSWEDMGVCEPPHLTKDVLQELKVTVLVEESTNTSTSLPPLHQAW